MNPSLKPRSGALIVVARDRGPTYYGKWRNSTGRQVKRLLGPAWVSLYGDDWRRRRGRVPEGVLDERARLTKTFVGEQLPATPGERV